MSTTINILATNDIHGRFFGGFGETGEIDFSRLRTLKESLENSLLVDIGDATQGTPLAILNKGLDPIDIMNCVGYDVVTIGNHEFDNITLKEGCENELHAVIDKSNAPFICANVFWKEGDAEPRNYIEYVYKEKGISGRGNGRYFVKEVAGKKLLFVGVCTADISATPKMKSYLIKGEPKNDQDNAGDSMDAEIRSAIADAKKAYGAFDAVILMAHLGKDSEKCSSSNLIKRMTLDDKRDIKLIIDGHSHKKYAESPDSSGRPYLIQADCYGKLCAHIKLTFNDAGGLTITSEFLDAVAMEKTPQSQEVKDIIQNIKSDVDKIFGAALCDGSNTTLWGGAVDEAKPFVPKDLAAVNITRHIHTNMGRLAAEAMAHYIRDNKLKDFDSKAEYIVAGINGGGVRDSIRFGQEITYGKLYNVTPSPREGLYDSGIAVFKISLSDLKKVLEHSISQIRVEGGLIATNAGMFLNTFGLKYTIENTGSRLKIGDSAILTCGVAFQTSPKTISFARDMDMEILICVYKYLAAGGDGYPFELGKDETILRTEKPIYEITGDYIERMALSSDEIIHYPTVSDDVQYSGFNFPAPAALSVTVRDDKGNLRTSETIVYAFANGKGYHNFGVTMTDGCGVFTVIPPEGANTLCVATLLGIESINHTFLYGEVFTHSYIKMEREIECQVSEMDSSRYCLFSKNYLSQFKHSVIGSNAIHHSNYLCYMDEKERLCYLTIVGGRIYRRECAESSYEVVDSVIYKNADGRYSTLTLPFPEYGIDYFHRASQSQKVHADLIGNPEVSEYYGGGDKIESSANYDGTLFAKNHQNKVTGIHIRSGEILDGIGFVYTGDDEFFFGSSTGGGETRIRFNMDEYIVRMTGAVNEIYPYYYCITNLRIITNKNPHGYGPFGSHKGEKTFSFGKDGKMIAAVLGEETTQEKWRYNLVKRIAVAYADITV